MNPPITAPPLRDCYKVFKNFFPENPMQSKELSFEGLKVPDKVAPSPPALRRLRLGKKPKEVLLMKRLVLLLGITCMALLLVMACGKQEEPAKAQKPAAQKAAPAQQAPAKAAAPAAKPEAKPAPAKPAAPPPAATQPTPTKPNPEKK
jgi:hypothetical protein